MASPFPDPAQAPRDEPLAYGGRLDPDLVWHAYRHGVFPWPHGSVLTWWSPDPRAVIELDGLHVSRTLRRTLRRGHLRVATAPDAAAAAAVIEACADRPDGSWITPAYRRCYTALAAQGRVHAVTVTQAASDRLVGGAYGVAVGGAFCAESMFHRVDDASKVALVGLVERLVAGGFALLDVQLMTDHLASMGAVAVARPTFLSRLADAATLPAVFPA